MIRSLRVEPVLVPMNPPHRTASGVVSHSPLVLATVTTDEGTGYSITFTYSPAALKPVADLMANMAPMIANQPLAPAEVTLLLTKRFRLLGTQGLVGMAIAGIDMALWDALARSRSTSLVRMLGGVERGTPAYGAVGYDGPAECARSAEDWAKRGFRGVKAKIGYPTVREDLEVIRAIRRAIGPDAAIMVDYNQSLTPTEAIQRLRVLEDENLAWVEEPVMAHDFRGHATVARASKTPITAGENWWGVADVQHAIDAGATDCVMLDAMKVGGVTGWLRAAALAEAAALPISSHLWPELSAQLLCLTPNAHWLEYMDWWNPIVAEPLRIENGVAMVEGVAGTGVAFAEKAVAAFAA
jgi:mandelate racemase